MSRSTAGEHFQSLFECAPISLWEEDYSGVKSFLDNLRARGILDLDRYLAEHPEEIRGSWQRIQIMRINQQALSLFGARSAEELLAHRDRIFAGETQEYIRSELLALWNGELNRSGEGIRYRLSGEALHVRWQRRIPPEYTADWECVLVSMEDVTALRQAEKRYRLLFEYAPISLWEEDYSALKRELDSLRTQGITDLQAYLSAHPEAIDRLMGLIRVLDVNQRTLQMFDADDKEMFLANVHRVFYKDRKEHFAEELLNLWNGITYYERNGINYSLSGEPVNVYLHWTLMPGYEADCGWVLVALYDVTERKRVEEYLRYLGTHDVMTGLYNRAFFEETLQKLQSNDQSPISFIVVDLNELKIANDSFGHHTGDKLIRRAAEVLKACIDEKSVVARIGGDEFIIILPGTDAETAHLIIERVQSLITVNNKYYPAPRLSLSLGAATSVPGLSLERIISLADDAMYANKGNFHHRRADDRADCR